MSNIEGRRPLKVRGYVLSQRIAGWLLKQNITPNQISITSILFAALAAVCLFSMPFSSGAGRWLLPIAIAVLIQCRLLCNLFDGMVAVEGGKSTTSGELFNEIPDRIADPLILIAAGYAATTAICSSYISLLGWGAGLLAVLTAYVRTLATATGAPTDFRGPMAKQHRMATMTVACVLTSFEFNFWQQGYILIGALAVIIVGCIITLWRRVRVVYLYLENSIDV